MMQMNDDKNDTVSMQSKYRDTDKENTHMVTKGEGGVGWIGRSGLTYIYMNFV